MNVSAILNFEKDPTEDYYATLGCDPSSSIEQILTEFKLRAKEFHPDKCVDGLPLESQEKFQQLLQVIFFSILNLITSNCLRKNSYGLYICSFNKSVAVKVHEMDS
jgi:hypothetical protein